MNRKDFSWITSLISWIDDSARRVGVIQLIKDSYADDPEFDKEEFDGWIKEKVFLNLRDKIFDRIPRHHVSGSCKGQKCGICGEQSTHKVGEEIMWDDPAPTRHNLTTYVCCDCFEMIMGPAVMCREAKEEELGT